MQKMRWDAGFVDVVMVRLRLDAAIAKFDGCHGWVPIAGAIEEEWAARSMPLSLVERCIYGWNRSKTMKMKSVAVTVRLDGLDLLSGHSSKLGKTLLSCFHGDGVADSV
ncbi:hypothetical protein ACLOJK_000238 [Asimina triloba]